MIKFPDCPILYSKTLADWNFATRTAFPSDFDNFFFKLEIDCRKVIGFAFTTLRDWLKRFAPLYSIVVYSILYNNPSYSRILIGSRLWSIRGHMHDWRHHYKVFPTAVLKWRKVLRIRIFYVTGQKIRYKNVLPRHWTGSRSQKKKDKAVSLREKTIKWYRNNFIAASVGSRARLNHAHKLGLGKPRTTALSRI